MTMDETYSDDSDHEACEVCGLCIDCGDCEKYGCGKMKKEKCKIKLAWYPKDCSYVATIDIKKQGQKAGCFVSGDGKTRGDALRDLADAVDLCTPELNFILAEW